MENGFNMLYVTLGCFIFIAAVSVLLYTENIFNKTYDKVLYSSTDTILVEDRGDNYE